MMCNMDDVAQRGISLKEAEGWPDECKDEMSKKRYLNELAMEVVVVSLATIAACNGTFNSTMSDMTTNLALSPNLGKHIHHPIWENMHYLDEDNNINGATIDQWWLDLGTCGVVEIIHALKKMPMIK
uniref:Uncharacterized protein n=1 Tax=Romanomermis culicivorax TaxID=13658 RepID=A0A915JK25_ROMCU